MKSLLKGVKKWVLKHRFLTLMLMAGFRPVAGVCSGSVSATVCLRYWAVDNRMDGASEKFLSSFYVIVHGLADVGNAVVFSH